MQLEWLLKRFPENFQRLELDFRLEPRAFDCQNDFVDLILKFLVFSTDYDELFAVPASESAFLPFNGSMSSGLLT